MKVIGVQWLMGHQLLLYVFDTKAWLAYGAGVLPGTDVPTYRFVRSHGFNGVQEAYEEGKELAYSYSHRLGFPGVQEHFESFLKVPAEESSGG